MRPSRRRCADPGRAGIIRGPTRRAPASRPTRPRSNMADAEPSPPASRALATEPCSPASTSTTSPGRRVAATCRPGWDVWNAAGSAGWKPGSQHTDGLRVRRRRQPDPDDATTDATLPVHRPAGTPPARQPSGRLRSPAVTLPPIPPSFNEADVSDKPPPNNTAKPLTAAQIAQVDHRPAADRSVPPRRERAHRQPLLRRCPTSRRLSDSAIFFTSDNGYMLGEHRLFKKGEPYEEPSHIPFVVRWPGGRPGRTERGVVSSIDLSATLCALAGATHRARRRATCPHCSTPAPRCGMRRTSSHRATAGMRCARSGSSTRSTPPAAESCTT